MARFFLSVLVVMALSACERDFEAGTGYGPKPGYSTAGQSYGNSGGLIAVDEVVEETSVVDKEDTSVTKDNVTPPTDTAGGDLGCTGTTSYCECMAVSANDEYCSCLETEEVDHAGQPFWCTCNIMVCGDNPNESFRDAYLTTCIEYYASICL